MMTDKHSTEQQQKLKLNKWVTGAPTWRHFNVRCPSCSKLYRVSSDSLLSQQPHFECKACHSQFSFEQPSKDTVRISTHLVSLPKLNSQNFAAAPAEIASYLKECPKCKTTNPKNLEDCVQCGVNFKKLEQSFDPLTKSRIVPSLLRAWTELMQDYENLKKHFSFVERCEEFQALPYALKRYELLKEVQPQDRVADQMWKHVFMKVQSNQNWKKLQASKTWRAMPIKDMLVWSPIIFAGVIAVIGAFNYQHRNLIGVAAAIVLIFIGFRSLFITSR